MENDLTYPIDNDLLNVGYKRLGWRNFWDGKEPQDYTNCRALGHSLNDESHSPRGSDHTVWCKICRYFYKFDTSD